jgi:hypothetical protein
MQPMQYGRALEWSAVVDQAISLYRRHWRSFVPLAAIAVWLAVRG